jgi:epoxyqueuosine reductase
MPRMSPAEITALVKTLTAAQGFGRTGMAPVAPLERADYYRQWLAAGRHGQMDYLARHLPLRMDPAGLLEGARSLIVVADAYRSAAPERPVDEPRGRVARYAWGRDYHRVVKRKLQTVCDRLHAALPMEFETRVCVDTAPLVEREWAARAGVGWIGKNTLVLDPRLGSFFFLGVIVTTLDLEPDAPLSDHCGTCTRCLQACPTGAFPAAYEMDAARCIAYLTIERRAAIPDELQAALGDWVFGCDVCQEVCPYNQKASPAYDPAYEERAPGAFPRLSELLEWSEADYHRVLQNSAMKRATIEMLQRNAALARANAERQRSSGA